MKPTPQQRPLARRVDPPLYQGLNHLNASEKEALVSEHDWKRTCYACRESRYEGEFTLARRESHRKRPDKDLRCNYCQKNNDLRYWVKPQIREDWRNQAACRGLDQDIFMEREAKGGRPAKGSTPARPRYEATCAACPVKKECLDYAHESRSVGVWGGVELTTKYHNERNGTSRDFAPRLVGEERAMVAKEMRVLYEGGYTLRQIADTMSRKYTTVYNLLAELGVEMRPPGGNHGRQ